MDWPTRDGSTTAHAWTAWGVTVLALSAAEGGAIVSNPSSGLPLAVSTLASQANALLAGAGRGLPLGSYAFAAGMAAAVNPCGFALLPAYLGLYLGTSSGGSRDARPISRALVVGATMTLGFVALFGLAGLALGIAAAELVDLLPWVSLLIGVLLTLLGGRMLAGAGVDATVVARLASRLGRRAGRADLIGYAAYGVAFALSSLGCTLPLFLSVVATALTADGVVLAATRFVLYALGMGVIVSLATMLVALFGRALVVRASVVGHFLEPTSALLLVMSGAYVVFYWLTVGGLLG